MRSSAWLATGTCMFAASKLMRNVTEQIFRGGTMDRDGLQRQMDVFHSAQIIIGVLLTPEHSYNVMLCVH